MIANGGMIRAYFPSSRQLVFKLSKHQLSQLFWRLYHQMKWFIRMLVRSSSHKHQGPCWRKECIRLRHWIIRGFPTSQPCGVGKLNSMKHMLVQIPEISYTSYPMNPLLRACNDLQRCTVWMFEIPFLAKILRQLFAMLSMLIGSLRLRSVFKNSFPRNLKGLDLEVSRTLQYM